MAFVAVTVFAAHKRFTLVIDAGHGGHDAGAVGSLTKEKTINLNVALAFGKLVEQNCPDVKVIYTRKTDVFIPLRHRHRTRCLAASTGWRLPRQQCQSLIFVGVKHKLWLL